MDLANGSLATTPTCAMRPRLASACTHFRGLMQKYYEEQATTDIFRDLPLIYPGHNCRGQESNLDLVCVIEVTVVYAIANFMSENVRIEFSLLYKLSPKFQPGLAWLRIP